MNFLLLTLFAFFFAVQASPLLFAPRTKLDVFTPNIITPNKSTTWCIGQTESVTWETDNAPPNISNAAAIYLAYPNSITSTWILLARDFDLLSGSQDVVVPTTITPGQYNIVVMGDSGNKSELFKIVLSADCPASG